MNFLSSLFSRPASPGNLLPLTRRDVASDNDQPICTTVQMFVLTDAIRLTTNTPLQAAEAGLLDQRVFISVKGSIN